MWTLLDPRSAKLEQIFKPLHDRALQFDRFWSIAEIKITEDDIRWLRSWFRHLTPASTENWIKSVMLVKLCDDTFISYGQMFGSLLICAGAEVCREESREDSVWPAIRSILPEAHELRSELFLSNGQPSSLTKDIIEYAVRGLNLRHVMDIEGTQQWFATIKLQFGFTYRGAKNRLAEWLVNLGCPHTVQYLNGDPDFPELGSKSFQSLWRALTQYRKGLIKEPEVRTTLERNPWIKPHWIDDLLKEAKAKIATLGIGDRHTEETEVSEEEASDEELCPIKDISLEWPHGKPPRIRFHLDRQTIEDEVHGTDISELDFYVDGKKLCRWPRQRNGSWGGWDLIFAEPDNNKQQPNISPMTMIVQSGTAEPLIVWDFVDSGLSEEVIVFDLERERIVKAGTERLEPNRRYAIVCDRKCEVQGRDPVEIFEHPKISRKVIRLASPLDENLCIAYQDFVLWQPVKSESEKRPRFPITLSTQTKEIISLNDRSRLFLSGLPEDSESVKLLIHAKTYELQRYGDGWLTLKNVTITPKLAARQLRVRVRFSSGNRTYNQEPRLSFRVIGAAMFRHKQANDTAIMSFKVLKKGDQLNRSEGATKLRIWAAGNEKGTVVLEGDCLVGRLRHQKIRLRDFPGHGGQLYIVNQGERHSLGVICLDRGCVHGFNPSMLGCDAQMCLLSDKNPEEAADDGYVLYMWFIYKNYKAKLRRIPAASILPTSRNRVWKIRDSCNPMAIALTWKGSWLGAWWRCEYISDYINRRRDLPEHDFAILKWLRVPVLHSTLFPILKKAVLQTPCRFINTWQYNNRIPDGLIPHDHIEGLDSVVRRFLWNDFPLSHSKEAITLLAQRDGKSNKTDYDQSHLARLSEISPILLWKGMEYHLKQDPPNAIRIVHTFSLERVGLLPNADAQQIYNRIQGLKKRVLKATSLDEERLEEIVNNRISGLHGKQWYLLGQDCIDLLKLGETRSGREYLAARMGQYWIDLSRK